MGYKTLEEWERDLNKFRSNPDDTKFFQSIVYRVNHTDPSLKDIIHVSLQDAIKWNNPLDSFLEITKDLSLDKGSIIIIQNKEDPWFTD